MLYVFIAKNLHISGPVQVKLVLFKLDTWVSSHLPKMCTLGELFLSCPTPNKCGVCECALRWEASCPGWGPTSFPELPGYAPASRDPDLESVGWKILLLLVFIHLTCMYGSHLFQCFILEVFWVFIWKSILFS